jgi:tRNA dimethylallyltransferase
MPKQNLIIYLMGPTASGKTDLAFQLAEKLPIEIISVDSGMIYREMNIGTAKPVLELLKKIPHHLIDICDPNQRYSAAQFRLDAKEKINLIFEKRKIPLLVGGTMLYFKVLEMGISPLPGSDEAIRKKILAEAEKYGWQKLHQKLSEIDPESAAKISVNDQQRIERALEVFTLTGKTMSSLQKENPPEKLNYKILKIVIAPKNRHLLNERISKRLELMLANGLVEEVKNLINQYQLDDSHPALRAIGYRQVFEYLQNKIDFQTMKNDIYRATCQLAKRQLTWIKTFTDAKLFDCDDPNLYHQIMNLINSEIKRYE